GDYSPRQQQRLRFGRGGLDARHQQSAPHGGTAASRHRLDQLLQRLRRGAAVRRLQAIRMGPRNGTRGAGTVHGSESGLHPAISWRRSQAMIRKNYKGALTSFLLILVTASTAKQSGSAVEQFQGLQAEMRKSQTS